MGNEPDRLPPHKFDVARRRGPLDLDRLAEIIHSRRLFGGHHLRPASGERGNGGLDLAA